MSDTRIYKEVVCGGRSPKRFGGWARRHKITQEPKNMGTLCRLFSREPGSGQGGVTDGLQGKGTF